MSLFPLPSKKPSPQILTPSSPHQARDYVAEAKKRTDEKFAKLVLYSRVVTPQVTDGSIDV